MQILGKRRGVALALVLLTTFLLVMLTSAFFGVHRTNLSLARAAGAQEAAHQACLSAFHYGRLRLEQDRQWGAAPFVGATDPFLSGVRVQEVAGTSRWEGEIPDLGQRFSGEVINRLGLDTPHPFENCPAGAVLLKLEGQASGLHRRLEVTLRKAPFSDSSAISNARMSIDAELFLIGSRDPYRSQVRSNDAIYAPDAVTAQQIRFLPKVGAPAPLDQPPHGSLWARRGIQSGSHSLSNSASRALAEASAEGSFLSGAAQARPVPQLTATDLLEHGLERSLAPGSYVFTSLEHQVMENRATLDPGGNVIWGGWTPVDPPVSTPALLHRDPLGQTTSVYYLNSPGFVASTAADHDPSDLILRQPVGWALPPGSPPPQPQSGRFEWPGSGMFVDLGTSTLEMPAGDVKVEGELAFTSLAERPFPALVMGSVDTSGSVPRPVVATLQAQGGISIRGTVDGFGAMMAGGDISLMARSQLTSTPERGVAIFSERDVYLRPNPGVPSAGGVQSFYGLVYAGRDFFFQGEQTTDPRWDLRIEGALIARDGGITIANSRATEFIYNPAYLDSVLRELAEGRVRLEPVCWRM